MASNLFVEFDKILEVSCLLCISGGVVVTFCLPFCRDKGKQQLREISLQKPLREVLLVAAPNYFHLEMCWIELVTAVWIAVHICKKSIWLKHKKRD